MPRRQGWGLMRMEGFGEDVEWCWFGDLMLSRGVPEGAPLLVQPGLSPRRGQALLSGLSRNYFQPSLAEHSLSCPHSTATTTLCALF